MPMVRQSLLTSRFVILLSMTFIPINREAYLVVGFVKINFIHTFQFHNFGNN